MNAGDLHGIESLVSALIRHCLLWLMDVASEDELTPVLVIHKQQTKMIRINVEIEDLKSVCYVASFYISVLFPVNPLHLHGGLLPHDFLFHLFRRSNLSIDFIWIAICLLEKLHTSIGKQEQIGSVYKLIVAAIILAHKSHSDIVVSVSDGC